MIQLVGDEPPAAILTTDECRRRNAHVIVEGDIDVVVREQIHGIHADTRRLHVHREERQAFVLLDIGIRTRREPDIVRIRGEAGKYLLAVDHVVVAVAVSTCGQRCQIRPRVGLGVPNTEVDLAPKDLRKEEILLFLGAVLHDRRRHAVDRQHGNRRPGPHGFIEEDELLDEGATLAAIFLGPADAQPTIRAHLEHHLTHGLSNTAAAMQLRPDLRREELVVIGPDFLAQGLLFFAVSDVHGGPPQRLCRN